MILLTKEEMQQAMFANASEGLPLIIDVDNIAKAQLRKVVKWGDEPCPHLIDEYGGQLRHDCGICWQSLSKEMDTLTKEELYKELAEIRANLKNRDLTFEERWREDGILKLIAIKEKDEKDNNIQC